MESHPPKESLRPGMSFILLCFLIALHGCGHVRRSHEGEGFLRKEYDTQVRFERSGGVAGMSRVTLIDSESLSEKENARLRDLIDQSGFFGLPEEILGPIRPDQFLYTITVGINGKQHTVRTSDTAAPGPLKPLIEWLNEAERREPGRTG